MSRTCTTGIVTRTDRGYRWLPWSLAGRAALVFDPSEHLRRKRPTPWSQIACAIFSVMGGHISAAGILTITLAVTSFRQHHWGAAAGIFFAGAASIGWMVIVNFIIDSDYKWSLLAIFTLWALSLGLFWFEKKKLR